MENKEAFKEILLQEIENIREQLVIEVDRQIMGLYDTLTEYLNEEYDEEIDEETNELSVLIADQIHAQEEQGEDIDEDETDNNVMELSSLIKEQATPQASSSGRVIRPVNDIIAELVSTVNQEVNEETEENMNELINQAASEPSDEQECTEDLSAMIKQALLADNIKKQLP